MKRNQRKIPPFKVWCRNCNGTDVDRVDEDNQGDMIVFKYSCNRCNEKWTTVYRKQKPREGSFAER